MIFGIGEYDRNGTYKRDEGDGKPSKAYSTWYGMFIRSYSTKALAIRPDYVGNSVDPRFHSFHDYAAWAKQQVGFGKAGFELDKDVLVKGNRVYGPDTCIFIPSQINSAMKVRNARRGGFPVGVCKVGEGKFLANIGMRGRTKKFLGFHATPEEAFAAFKAAKEGYIQTLAREYKDVIDPRAYEALMNYEVLITD